MQTVRQYYEDTPSSVPIPKAFQHKRVEVILLMHEEASASPIKSLKSLLAEMPDVGEDSDFARQTDTGRKDEPWDI